MSDSIEIKSKNKQESLDAELDAMLDEAALSLTSLDNHQTDEDVIDKLLLDAGFDVNEDFPSLVDDSILTTKFDDDFDLADISTNSQISETETHPDELETDFDFPLDLLDSVALTTDEQQNTVDDKTEDNEDFPIAPLDTLQNEQSPDIEDNSLTDQLNELSDFDEFSDFQDFQRPEIIEDINTDSSFSEVEDTSEYDEMVEQVPLSADPILDDNDLIVDVADLAAIDEAINYDEFSDEFDDQFGDPPVLAPTTKIAESVQPGNEEAPASINTDVGINRDDFDITAGIDDDLFNNLDQEDELLQEIDLESTPSAAIVDETIVDKAPEQSPDNLAALIEAAGIPALMQFKSDQETVNKRYKKQIADFETNAKKASLITYVALGFGIVSTVAAVILGFLFYGAKNHITQLVTQVTTLEQGLGNISAKNLSPDPKNTLSEPLTHKADEIMSPLQANPETLAKELKQEPSPDTTAHESENKSPESKKKASAEVSENAASTTEMPHESNEPLKVEPPVLPTTASHEVDNKTAEPQKENVTAEKKSPLSEASTAAQDQAIENPSLPAAGKTQVSEHNPVEKTGLIEKKTKPITRSKTETIKKKQKSITATSNWAVNLIAYKQEWYASSKANELMQKGVPVEIIPVRLNNVTWYRLRVGGFNDREEASIYAGRIKKALNLSSVWVGNK